MTKEDQQVYRYEDDGQAIHLTSKQSRFLDLWRHIEGLDLPHLKPTAAAMTNSTTFDPSAFFQKIS